MNHEYKVRYARNGDAFQIASVYNQAIDERKATFNTEYVTEEEIIERIGKDLGKYPVIVAVDDFDNVIGYCSITAYSSRACYAGIGEVSLYVKREFRGKGVGYTLLRLIIDVARQKGYWKLIGRLFIFNEASRRLCRKVGFREIGVLKKHGKLDGQWIDVIEVEKLIPENII